MTETECAQGGLYGIYNGKDTKKIETYCNSLAIFIYFCQ